MEMSPQEVQKVLADFGMVYNTKNNMSQLGGFKVLLELLKRGRFNERLAEREGNLKRAADKLHLKYQRLRQDLSENRFSEADLKILCRAVGLPTDLPRLRSEYALDLRTGVRGPRKIEEQHRAMLAAQMKFLIAARTSCFASLARVFVF